MAINVNDVYTTVLSILNKEQRGYLTPYEFNQIATQVQLEIFEKFFEDYNQYIRMPKTDVEFASRMEHVYDEFQIFNKYADASAVAGNVYDIPSDLHRFGSAYLTRVVGDPEIQIVSERDFHEIKLSPLTKPTINFPVAVYREDKLHLHPEINNPAAGDVKFSYMRKPADVVWAYEVGARGQYIWSGSPGAVGPFVPVTGSVDFEIDDSQQTEVIISILKYAGVVIRDPQIVQAASQELAQQEANTKR